MIRKKKEQKRMCTCVKILQGGGFWRWEGQQKHEVVNIFSGGYILTGDTIFGMPS